MKRVGRRGLILACVFAASIAGAPAAFAGTSNLGTAGSLTYILDQVSVGANSSYTAAVPCPEGTRVTSGGFLSELQNVWPASMSPADDESDIDQTPNDAWFVSGTNSDSGQFFHVRAICSTRSLAYRTGPSISLDTEGAKTAQAKCAADEHVVGGGALVTEAADDSVLNSSYPIDRKDRNRAPDDGWKARVYNPNASPATLVAHAVCSERRVAYSKKAVEVDTDITVTKPRCENDLHVAGLGFKLSGPAAAAVPREVLSQDAGASDGEGVPDERAWLGAEKLDSAERVTLTGYALCTA